MKGTVRWFDPKMRYGFIAKEEGGDVFVHASSIEGKKFRSLCEGDKVAFNIAMGSKGPVAVGVTVEERSGGNRRERGNRKDRNNAGRSKYEWKSMKKRNNGNSKSVHFTQETTDQDV